MKRLNKGIFKPKKFADNSTSKHQAFHNMGNVFMKQKDYAKAVETYKNALRNNPQDEETRYNYALAKELLEKEQQQQDNKEQDQQDQKNQDNQENKDKEKDGDKDQDSRENKEDNESDKGEDEKDKNDEGNQEKITDQMREITRRKINSHRNLNKRNYHLSK